MEVGVPKLWAMGRVPVCGLLETRVPSRRGTVGEAKPIPPPRDRGKIMSSGSLWCQKGWGPQFSEHLGDSVHVQIFVGEALMGRQTLRFCWFSFGGGFAGEHKFQTGGQGAHTWLTQISSMVQPEMGHGCPPRDQYGLLGSPWSLPFL